MSDKLTYKLRSGKPNKALYFLKGMLGTLVPDCIYRARLQQILEKAKQRKDYDYCLERANYYNKVCAPFSLPKEDLREYGRSIFHYVGRLGDFKRNMFHTAYFLDQHDVTRFFDPNLRWSFLPGDVYFTPESPTVVKSRLLEGDNTNSVLLKLDKLRHFLFVEDPVPFREKQDKVIFRGKIRQSRLRTAFLEQFFAHPLCDCGVVGRNEGCPEEWMQPKITIREHLDYKFIMAIEGNDVASNLKWVMSSNSLAVMPRPTCETWFMEGKLEAGKHYVEVRDDYADLEEKLQHYIQHPEEAEEIIRNAHDFVRQFRDPRREELIQLLVMDKYLRLSQQ